MQLPGLKLKLHPSPPGRGNENRVTLPTPVTTAAFRDMNAQHRVTVRHVFEMKFRNFLRQIRLHRHPFGCEFQPPSTVSTMLMNPVAHQV